MVLAVLTEQRRDQEVGHSEKDAFAELGRRIMGLHAASAEELSGCAEDVVDAAREAGFEGLDGRARFRQTADTPRGRVTEWAESMGERYNVFGHVEPGDRVRVEQEPVVLHGEIREKGLVRKQRGQ
jgi:hypothetical protein